jgi:hypothetical protein
MEEKIKYLTHYLPYGVNSRDHSNSIYRLELSIDNIFRFIGKYSDLPILRPIQDLAKEIDVNNKKIIPIVELAKIANIDTTDYNISFTDVAVGLRCNIENDDDDDKYEVFAFDTINGFGHHFRPSNSWAIVNNQIELWNKLYEYHIDVFGLIEKGIAIDINTLS